MNSARLLFAILSLSSLIAFSSYGSQGSLPIPQIENDFKPQELNLISALPGIYKFTEDSDIFPLAFELQGEMTPNFENWVLDVKVNEPAHIEYLSSGDVLMTIAVPDEEKGLIPETFILSQEEFQYLNLELESAGSIEDFKELYHGYDFTDVAGNANTKPRKHGFRKDRNGRIAGGSGNCVRVVKSLTGFSGTAGNGKGMAEALLRWGGRKYKSVSSSSRIRGMVCSWTGGSHGKGHVGWFDGKCFQPTYEGNCGNPGKKYRMKKCVAPA